MTDKIYHYVFWELSINMPKLLTNPLYEKMRDNYFTSFGIVPLLRRRNMAHIYNPVEISVQNFIQNNT